MTHLPPRDTLKVPAGHPTIPRPPVDLASMIPTTPRDAIQILADEERTDA